MRRTRLLILGMMLGAAAGLILAVMRAHSPAARTTQGGGWLTQSADHMATTISLTIRDDERAAEAMQIISEVFGTIDQEMSEWKPGSQLTHVNLAAGQQPVTVSPELYRLIQRSLQLAEMTDGAFDPTWAALWGLWDFKSDAPSVPNADAIAHAAALVDYRKVTLDDNARSVFLSESGMKLGLGGIAKGHAIDVSVENLRLAGFEDFLLIAGGQVYASGTRDGQAWRVGIRDPRGGAAEYFATVELHDAAISTSGDYERYFEIDGERFHHILDPGTGWPTKGPRSVTVISRDATLADAMSTALMIVDPAHRSSIMARTGLSWALIVERDGRVTQVGKHDPSVSVLTAPRADESVETRP